MSIERNGRLVWSDGTFAIPEGAVVGVIGPNGSGKTTLLEMLLGLLPPTAGALRVLGDAPRRGNPRIGYVPQNYTAAVGDAVRCRDLVELGLSGTRPGFGRRSGHSRSLVDDALAAVDASVVRDPTHVARVGRPAAARRHRAGPRPRPGAAAPRRAPRQPRHAQPARDRGAARASSPTTESITVLIVAHDLNPLLSILTGAIYLLDGHAHYDEIGRVVDEDLLSHLYGTAIRVVRTPQGDLFTRNA